jgi:hypothetical protein
MQWTKGAWEDMSELRAHAVFPDAPHFNLMPMIPSGIAEDILAGMRCMRDILSQPSSRHAPHAPEEFLMP